MMSKWGRESSVEMLSDSDNSYQTPPVVGSLQWDQLQGEPTSEEAGEICWSLKSWKSLSSIQSQSFPASVTAYGSFHFFFDWTMVSRL